MNPTPATGAPWDQDRADARRAAAGDAEAFERLYRRHLGRVNALACRMSGPQEAEDLIQEIFVRAWQKLHLFRGESAFGTWLHRLAVNLIVERFRSATARRAGLHDGGEGVMDVLQARPSRPHVTLDLEAAIQHVPPGAREIFVLHDVEGYRHTEIADLLGVAVGTSKAQLHRARMILRELLT
ncbi:MAG: RNA polymerase sigma factor [Acidobacteria bacterium]|nr:RNA polymerase sigma factor [Acidobacteriota bacterium]